MTRIGIITSGGDAPGMNAAIRAVVRAAMGRGVEVVGFMHGFDGIINDESQPLDSKSVGGIITQGGTMLRSARSDEFRMPEGRLKAMRVMASHGIGGLVVIGGDVDSFSYDDAEKGKSIGRTSFLSTTYCMQNPSREYSNNSCISETTPSPTPTPISTTTPTPTINKASANLKSSVLGASVESSSNHSYEPVRPTQYYERPTMVEEKSLEVGLKNNNSKTETSPDNHAVKVVRTSALISALASFLTAGLIFIRIML